MAKPAGGAKAKQKGGAAASSSSSSQKEDSNLSNHKSKGSSAEGDSNSEAGAAKTTAENGVLGGEEGDDSSVCSAVDQESQEREKLLKVLSGSLDDLPPLSSKIVRIFTSSTFTGKSNLLLKIFVIIRHIVYLLP
ncbi:hypothetical protein PoB_000699900 [Plakobranchus ocellatus]|uniref:Uncharacterized protein n=1 Tax=Plakobranchus ocellatus TaxID=259542 RepID=A0AAV3YE06_9GAST|nr:hypothetical protein PoB_000699900 [Plakobranchus ocellatus]